MLIEHKRLDHPILYAGEDMGICIQTVQMLWNELIDVDIQYDALVGIYFWITHTQSWFIIITIWLRKITWMSEISIF